MYIRVTLKMFETAAILAVITESTEIIAIPAVAGWLTSEVLTKSKSKHNAVYQVVIGLIKAVAKEITEKEPEVEMKKPIRKKTTPKQRLNGSVPSKPTVNRRGRKMD